MRLLLDTHIFLCVVAGHSAFKPATRRCIDSADEVYVSTASIWEISIKARLGKLELHHNDPFDRLSLAQAQLEPLHLLMADAVPIQYSELIVLV